MEDRKATSNAQRPTSNAEIRSSSRQAGTARTLFVISNSQFDGSAFGVLAFSCAGIRPRSCPAFCE
ncbi:MAG: hypothetical protein DME74_02375 [Verrucomicrobia bacterium]|nr:MAG: hypothetical protein DME74_02375 [Verrucomicrobiota bacterium]